MRKNTLAAASVAVAAVALAASSCEQHINPQQARQPVSITTSYGMIETHSMLGSGTKAADNEAVVAALSSMLPDDFTVYYKAADEKEWSQFTTGETLSLIAGTEYTFEAEVQLSGPEDTYYFQSCTDNRAAGMPFFKVATTVTFTENDTEFTVPTEYDCFALVAPKDAVKGFKTIDGSWKELPDAVVGDYRICFIRGDYSGYMAYANTYEGYAPLEFKMPSCSTDAGKYFWFDYTVTPAGKELSVSSGFSIIGGWSAGVWQ